MMSNKVINNISENNKKKCVHGHTSTSCCRLYNINYRPSTFFSHYNVNGNIGNNKLKQPTASCFSRLFQLSSALHMLTTKFIRRLFSSSSSSSSSFQLDLRSRIRRRASSGTKILVIRRRRRCTASRADLDRVLSSNNSTAPAPAPARQLGQEYHYEPNNDNKSKTSTVINPNETTQLQVIRVATFNVALFSMAPAVVRRVSNYSSSTSTASTFASAYNNNVGVGVGDHHEEDLEEEQEEEEQQLKRACAEGVQADHEAGTKGVGSSWRRSVELGHRVGGGSDADRNHNNRPKGILKVKQQQYRSSSNLSVNFLKCSPAAAINGINLQAVKQQQQQQKLVKKNNSKLIKRVSINLPENEISISRSRELVRISNSTALVSTDELDQEESSGRLIMRRRSGGVIGSMDQAYNYINYDINDHNDIANYGWRRSMVDVLKEVKADVLALQEVRAEEEKGMKPLSELAEALGMRYVFAESWAPEYGNAVLSKWPIKRWQVQNIPNNSDYRNVLKVVIDVPSFGEVNFYCTHLDHLDEKWRMKQVASLVEADAAPYVLIGCLNSLDESDYSQERWCDIVKYYQEIGKPTPKADVMKYLKSKKYIDAKSFAGDCEAVVVLAKGQDVQGTCKYGTRVDYILASPNLPYKFVPQSYSVVSSKGTSDHHLVKVDIQNAADSSGAAKPRTVKIKGHLSTRGIWKTNS